MMRAVDHTCALGQIARGASRFVAGVMGVALLAAGVPLAWVWIGSQVQGGTAPSEVAIVTVIAGLAVSYGGIGTAISWFVGRRGNRHEPSQAHYRLYRSLSAERRVAGRTTWLENVVIVATIVVAIVCAAWFLLWGDPGVPGQ